MACCVISCTALTDLISWYRTIDSLYSDGFEVDPAGPGRTALASPRARGSFHRGSRHRPRVRVRLIMASVMIMSTPKFFGLPDTPLEREPRTVIHVKRAKMFDPMG